MMYDYHVTFTDSMTDILFLGHIVHHYIYMYIKLTVYNLFIYIYLFHQSWALGGIYIYNNMII